MNDRSLRMLRSLVRQLSDLAGGQDDAPVSSDFMRGYRKGCADTYRLVAEWIAEAVPEVRDLPEAADGSVLDRRVS